MPEPINLDTEFRTDLEKLSDPELKAVALRLKVTCGPRIGRPTLINRIAQQPKSLIQDALKAFNDEPLAKEKPDFFQSEDEVRDACKEFLKKDGFEVKFDHNEDTFHFSYRGRIESGTLHQPMKNIRQTASRVSMGPFVLRAAPGFEKDTGASPNAYAQNCIQ